MSMKSKIHYLILIFILIPFTGFSDNAEKMNPASWTVSHGQYQYSMTITCLLVFDGQESTDMDDKVAAFVGDDCRGVAQPITFVPSTGQYLAYLMIYSNVASGEQLSLMMYDKSADTVRKAVNAVLFKANSNYGYPEDPYVVTTNNIPTDISLSNHVVDENAANTEIGIFTTTDLDDPEQTMDYAYSLEDPDENSTFSIDGNTLFLNKALNYEAQSSHTIKVTTDDLSGGIFTKSFVIDVNDVNDPPTGLNLTASTIIENQEVGKTIGYLSVEDQDNNDTHSFEFINDETGKYFYIEDTVLKSKIVFDYEKQNQYPANIRVTDTGGSQFDTTFTIRIIDNNDPFSDIVLSNNKLAENESPLTTIGTLTAIEEDTSANEQDVTFSLVDNTSNNDNQLFILENNTLKSNTKFDYEERAFFTVEIRVTDSEGLFFVKQFGIVITDVNEAPQDISFFTNNISENDSVGKEVGAFSTTDPDENDVHQYTFAEGVGDADNIRFNIVGDRLILDEVLDFETQSEYHIRIQSGDSTGLSFEKRFTVSIKDKNEPPVNIFLSSAVVDINNPTKTNIGQLSVSDPDSVDNHRFSLPDGLEDNDSFIIDGNTLVSNIDVGAETKSDYTIIVRVEDKKDSAFQKAFDIKVLNYNDYPLNIELSSSSIVEHSPQGTLIGRFITSDPDPQSQSSAVYTYSLVSGEGSEGNDFFTIDGDQLISASVFNFESKNVYSVRVRVEDPQGGYLITPVTINITDDNDKPTDILLSSKTIHENLPSSSVVGSFSSVDEDANDNHVFELLPDEFDNGLFYIENADLCTKQSFDYEEQEFYTVRISTYDAEGEMFTKTLTIRVMDGNDAPEFQQEQAEFTLSEKTETGQIVGQVSAMDKDNAQNLYYAFANPGNIPFSIDEYTGEITVNDPTGIDYETKSSYVLTVKVTDDGPDNLSDEISVRIVIQDANETVLDATNYFSPNNDGINDYWTIPSVEIYEEYELFIYNAAGEIVYNTKNYQNDWDGSLNGEELPVDVYYYVLVSDDGSTTYKGSITLMR